MQILAIVREARSVLLARMEVVEMNGRAWVAGIPAMVLATIACSKATTSDDRLGGVRSGADIDFVALCSYEPWNGGPATTECGDASTLHHRATCDELGPGAGVTLALSAPDSLGIRQASHEDPSGITTSVNVDDDTGATVVNSSWSFGTTVKPDGSTMAFDAMVFTSNTGDDSEVIRFTEPQFFVRNLTTTIGVVDQIELCGYRAFQSPSLPPVPDPHRDGPFTLDCSGGSTSAPGTTVQSSADIHWTVSVSPTPDASLTRKLSVFATTQDSVFQSGNEYALTNGTVSGGADSVFLQAVQTTIIVRFTYANAECTMYWNVEGGSSSSSSGGGQTW
jgi:hypothetical protein